MPSASPKVVVVFVIVVLAIHLSSNLSFNVIDSRGIVGAQLVELVGDIARNLTVILVLLL
jgi:hypothetical protein